MGGATGGAVGVRCGMTVVGNPGGGSDVRVQGFVRMAASGIFAANCCAGGFIFVPICELEKHPTITEKRTRMVMIRIIVVDLFFIVLEVPLNTSADNLPCVAPSTRHPRVCQPNRCAIRVGCSAK